MLRVFEVPERTVAAELRLDVIVAGGANLPTAVMPSPLPGIVPGRLSVICAMRCGKLPPHQQCRLIKGPGRKDWQSCELPRGC